MSTTERPFWQRKTLDAMTDDEWESLCDGCARCCTVKIEEHDSGAILQTAVACRLLDLRTCRCTDYADRLQRVPGCLRMTPERARDLDWLPSTCAYRRLARGLPLPEWHPLITGDPESVHRAGASIRDHVISEELVHEDAFEFFIIDHF